MIITQSTFEFSNQKQKEYEPCPQIPDHHHYPGTALERHTSPQHTSSVAPLMAYDLADFVMTRQHTVSGLRLKLISINRVEAAGPS